MLQSRRLTIAVCVIMLAAAVTIGGGVGAVTAQEDGVPSLPATYYGEITAVDGDIDTQIRIDSVADGEIEDSIIADTDGAIGGSTITDEKLEAQQPDDGSVEFHIAGEPVTVLSLDGTPVNDESVTWQEATQEIELEINSVDDIPTSVNVSITDADSPVDAEETLSVTVEIENTGSIEATRDVELQTENDTVVDSSTTTTPLDGTSETTLSWDTTADDVGEQTLTVVAGNETATTDVEIETPDIAEPDPGGDNGGQTGPAPAPAPSDDADDTPDADQPDEAAETVETQSIVSSDDFGISQVRFTEQTSLASITWDTPAIPEDFVTVETYTDSPDGVPAVPGDVLTVSDVSLPENASDEPATVEFRADQEAIDAVEATPEELTIARLADDSWERLDTTVTDETNTTVLLEAETPGFSNFAVTTDSPAAVIDAPESAPAGSELTVEATNSSTPFGEIVSYEWTIDDESHTGERVTTEINDPGETTIELTVENDAGDTDTTTTTLTTTEDETPGFGVLAALGALFAVALLLHRRTQS